MKRETKTAVLNLRTAPAVRDMAKHLAKHEGRSVVSMIERLIEAAHAAMNEDAARR